jgi:competence protein ComEC
MSKKEIFIIFILIVIAFVRFLFFIPKIPLYDGVVGKNIVVEGIISDSPDIRLSNKHLILTPTNQDTDILLFVSKDIEVSYGDKVRIKGILEKPENFITSSGKEFDYKKYLANQNIYFIVKNPEMEIISQNNGNFLKAFLFKIRNSFLKNINKVILPPESDLASGLILGVRGGFDSETRDQFIQTGTIHIIALSGYNVTIVAEWVMKILRIFFSQVLSIGFGILVIILFIMMSGATATSIRAGIMAVIALFARLTGRTYDAGRALVIAGLIMFAYDPRIITDISFQLSFLATFGVLFITPKVFDWIKFIPIKFGLREVVSTTISATIAVLPILLYSTGILSLVSLPANILILSFIPITMLFSFLVGILGFLGTVFSFPFGFISHLLLSYILYIIDFFASLPFASVIIPSFSIIFVFIIYGFIFWWVFRK